MSMIRCDRCSVLIDSDDDPECFTSKDKPHDCEGRVLCEPCREQCEVDEDGMEGAI